MAPTRPPLAEALDLAPHPEGGWYRETWATRTRFHPDGYPGERASATAIHFLLEPGEESRWHRVRSDELWLWHRGGPLTLLLGGAGNGPNNSHTSSRSVRPSSAARCPRRWSLEAAGRPPGQPPEAGCSSAAWSRRGSTSRTSSYGDSELRLPRPSVWSPGSGLGVIRGGVPDPARQSPAPRIRPAPPAADSASRAEGGLGVGPGGTRTTSRGALHTMVP